MPWNRPFHVVGSQTAMWMGWPAGSAWVRATAQKLGSPVTRPPAGELKVPEVSRAAESTLRRPARTRDVRYPAVQRAASAAVRAASRAALDWAALDWAALGEPGLPPAKLARDNPRARAARPPSQASQRAWRRSGGRAIIGGSSWSAWPGEARAEYPNGGGRPGGHRLSGRRPRAGAW